MKKVYNPDDCPKPLDLVVSSTVKSLLKQTPVRETHEDVNVNVGNKRCKADPLQSDDPLTAKVKQFLDMMNGMMQKAKNIDDCKLEFLAKRGAKLEDAEQVPSTQLALPNLSVGPNKCGLSSPPVSPQKVADEWQLATIPGGNNEDSLAPTKKELPAAGKTLEDFEKDAMEKLQAQKSGGKTLKRPAAAKSKQNKVANTKMEEHEAGPQVEASAAKTKPPKPCPQPNPKIHRQKSMQAMKASSSKVQNTSAKKKGSWGCIRCRGNTSGCTTCKKPGFGGTRLNGRKAWKAYMAKKGKKV